MSFSIVGGDGKFCNEPEVAESVFDEYHFTQHQYNIDGLGCVDNRTLNFYALDIETQKVLGEKIGLNFEKNSSGEQDKFVIVSPDQEVAYEMNANLEKMGQSFSLRQSISTFVNMFHNNPSQLLPLRISKQLNITSTPSSGHSNSSSSDNCEQQSTISCIKEINGETFKSVVLEESSNKHVVLLYKTASCAFCTASSSAAHVFHTVNRLFR